MKRLGSFLILEAIISTGLAYLMYYIIKLDNSMALLYLPIDWLGGGLRWLSLSSSMGNIVALFCYVAVSLIPTLFLAILIMKARCKTVDLFLPIISIYTFYMLYCFINPSNLIKHVPQLLSGTDFLPMVKLAFAILFYSLLLCYLFIRISGTLEPDNTMPRLQYLCKRLHTILTAASSLYIFIIGYFFTYGMFEGLNKYVAKEADSLPLFTNSLTPSSNAVADQFVVILSYILHCLPAICAVLIMLAGIRLLHAMEANHLKEEEYLAAAKLSDISKWTVSTTVLSNLALNAVQFLLSNQLTDSSFNLNITFMPLIIAFSALILSGYFKESKELQEDNEMII